MISFGRLWQVLDIFSHPKSHPTVCHRQNISEPNAVVGHVPSSDAGAKLPFEMAGQACEHHSLMVTTNLPFNEWPDVFGSERLTGALLGRLTHRCHFLEANENSYRLKDSK